MKTIWVTQRVVREQSYNEVRDALDQQWVKLLKAAGYFVQLVPNNLEWLEQAMTSQLLCDGVLFTGGNDLVCVGGDAIERDEVERQLLSYALKKHIPVLGVCRGMQLIATEFGSQLEAVENQVQRVQTNMIDGQQRVVNSFHRWALVDAPNDFRVFAWSEDAKVIKGIQHLSQPIYGVMWHPERIVPFSEHDIGFIQRVFS